MNSMMHRGAAIGLVLATVLQGDAGQSEWKEVLYQAFQTGALSAEIILHDRPLRVPMGWISLSESGDTEHVWTMARWDGGNDRRTVDRTYLATNGNGLPGCWLTKLLSYEVGPEFELQFVMLNYGTPVALTMRVVDDHGIGYDATISMGVDDQKSSIRAVVEPSGPDPTERRQQARPSGPRVLATSGERLPAPQRLQWHRPKLTCKNNRLVLSMDGRELARTKRSPDRTFAAVQFMSPQRVFLDDFEMWGTVEK